MNDLSWIIEHEISIRIGFFVGVFAIVALWEILAPRRKLSVGKASRWVNNLTLVALNSIMLRLLFPAAAIGVAIVAAERGWGLLHIYPLPGLVAIVLAVIALDFFIYLQHVLVHAVPALWRLHRVHHADLDYDVTTGARFHTLEIILSMLIKFATITVIGAPVIAVIIFEVLLNATAMFNHGNVRIPARVDRFLRWFIVTPDMHRIHHSSEDDEANSNFGFSLPWWDRLFGTYRQDPRAGQIEMQLGIHNFRDPKIVDQLSGMLALPFIGEVDDYAINRRRWAQNNDQ